MGCNINTGSAQLTSKLGYKSFSSTVHLKMIKIVNFMLCGFLSQFKKLLKNPIWLYSFIEMKVLNRNIFNYRLLVLNHVVKMTCTILNSL